MANAAMRALRVAQAQVNAGGAAGDGEPKIVLDLGDVEKEEEKEDEGPKREEPGRDDDEEDHREPVLYDDDFDLDQPALMGVLANEEVAGVHARINFNRHLRVIEQQCLQQAAFMKYLWGTVVPHFSEIWTAKDKAEKSNTGLRTELKKAREDLAVRTAEAEAAKKEANDLCDEVERVQKAGNSSSGMGKQEVTTLIKKNLARHQSKWEEEKSKLVALGANLVKESFENAMAQIRLRNPDLNLDGMSHEFEMLHGHICRVDTEARKLYDVDTGDEVADWDEDGEYGKGN
ncbi:putative cytoskeleton-associated protein 4 [Sesbania bispinosa]|nr:putative cytoskeleton-associated protein 4 [Sesbania bispinosa]